MKKDRLYGVSVKERIMLRTKVPLDKNECWLWCGPVNNAGYGMIKGDSKQGDYGMVTVHRAMAKSLGLNIHRKEVQHTCLNTRCVNPEHLKLGDIKSRTKRIIAKHGSYYMKPKHTHKTCEHCNGTTHIIWFNRRHKDCYPGMHGKYHKSLRK